MAGGVSVDVLRGVFCIDPAWKIRSINDAAAVIFSGDKTGREAAAIIGSGLDAITGFDASGKGPSRELVGEALESRFGASVTEYLCCAESGMTIVCFAAQSAGQTVEKRIADVYRQNRKLTMIGMFAAGIAHDYNNALTAVLGNISLAKLEAGENQELLDLLKDAEKASLRIKGMTERLTLYSRGIKLNRSRFDIVNLADRVFNRVLAGFCGNKNFKSTDGSLEVDADRALVEMAIESLLENAAEAAGSQNGFIELDITREEIRQEQHFREMSLVAGSYMKVSVKDSGGGFPPEAVKAFFDPYYSTKNGHEGIGLALAYAIIKRHRGYISAESSGDGAVFSIFIPLF